MLAQDTVCQPVIGGKELRRHIDRAVSRALVDREFERQLLSDPTVVLEDQACQPQHYLSLLSIQAKTLLDFARQAQALFWAIKPYQPEFDEEDALPLAALAS